MRQLFKRTSVLLPLLALLAVPAEGSGQWGRPWNQATDPIPHIIESNGRAAKWSFFQAMDAGIIGSSRP